MGENTTQANPRQELAESLRQLRAAAGNPSMDAVVARARTLVEPRAGWRGRPVQPPTSRRRIGDWEAGRSVPANWAQFELVLRALIERAAREQPTPPSPGFYRLSTWRALWTAARESDVADGVCPYRGLEPFDTNHAAQFFGRTAAAEEVMSRLQASVEDGGPLMVVGSSGVGKSSLIRAGLLPRIAEGRLSPESSARWPVVIISPGADPIAALLGALPELAETLRDDHSPTALAPSGAELAASGGVGMADSVSSNTTPVAPGGAARVREALRNISEDRAGAGARTVLVVDQFEEVFTLCAAAHRRRFLELLSAVTDTSADSASPPVLLIIGVRDEFYPQCLKHRFLAAALNDHQAALEAMTASDLREVITGPAEGAGLRIERGLVEVMLSDAGVSADRADLDVGLLPLVSHVLRQTWEHRKSGTLTIDGYVAAGRISGAVEKTAEAAWAELDDAGKRAADQLIPQLMQIGDGVAVPDTRRRCRREELLDHTADREVAETALEVLVRARLVTVEGEWVQLAHESLLRTWPRLPVLINQHRKELLLSSRVEADARAWEQASRDVNLLYRGGRLEDAVAWTRDATLDQPSSLARRFVGEAQRHRRRRAVLRSAVAVGGVALALVAGVAALVASRQTESERFAETLAEADRLASMNPSLASRLYLVGDQMRAHDPEVEGRLLSTQNSPLAASLPSPSGAIYDVAFSADGRTLATASYSGVVQLWDMADRTHRVPIGPALKLGAGYASSTVFSPDGNLLVGAGEDGTIRTWDVRDRAHPRPLGGPLQSGGGEVYLIRFSPDGKWLAAACHDGAVRIWSIADPAHPTLVGPPLPGSGAQMRTVAWAPTRPLLAAGDDDGQVWVWDISNPALPRRHSPLTGATGAVHTVAFSPDSSMLAAGGDDKHTRIWDISNLDRPSVLGIPLGEQHGAIWSADFSPDGRMLATASADGSVRLWGVSHPAGAWPVLTSLGGNTGPMWSLRFTPDGSAIAAGAENGTTLLWSIPATVLVGHTGRVLSLAINRAGTLLASGGADHCIRLWEIRGPNRPRPRGAMCGGSGFVYGLAFSPSGTRLVSESAQDGLLKVWDIHDPDRPTLVGSPIPRRTQWAGVTAFSPDGRVLVTGDTDNTVQLWAVDADVEHLTPLGPPLDAAADGLGVNADLFTPDGRTLITVSSDGTARLWDVSDSHHPATVATINPRAGQLLQAALSPDGRTLATTGEDKQVRLWDISDRTHPMLLGVPLSGSSQPVDAVTFDPTGRTLVSGSADATARIWDVSDPTAVPASVPLTGPTAGINAALSTPDGHYVTASEDNTIMIWDPIPAHSIARICSSTQGVITPESSRETRLSYTATCGE